MNYQNLKTITFDTKEEASKFSSELGNYLENVLTHTDFCNYIMHNKDNTYKCLVVPTHDEVIDIVTKDINNLQLFNDVVLEMFLLSTPK